MPRNERMLVAIIDIMAEDITPLHCIWIHRHLATAIRMYHDIANDPQTQVHQHIDHYDLVQLGTLNELNRITPTYALLLSGKTYQASLQNQQADGDSTDASK